MPDAFAVSIKLKSAPPNQILHNHFQQRIIPPICPYLKTILLFTISDARLRMLFIFLTQTI